MKALSEHSARETEGVISRKSDARSEFGKKGGCFVDS